jgi:hypothetical protein
MSKERTSQIAASAVVANPRKSLPPLSASVAVGVRRPDEQRVADSDDPSTTRAEGDSSRHHRHANKHAADDRAKKAANSDATAEQPLSDRQTRPRASEGSASKAATRREKSGNAFTLPHQSSAEKTRPLSMNIDDDDSSITSPARSLTSSKGSAASAPAAHTHNSLKRVHSGQQRASVDGEFSHQPVHIRKLIFPMRSVGRGGSDSCHAGGASCIDAVTSTNTDTGSNWRTEARQSGLAGQSGGLACRCAIGARRRIATSS